MTHDTPYRIGLIAVLALAAVLRFGGLGDEAIWMDEAATLWFSDLDWGYLWKEIPKFENHPPLYYMLLKAWRMIAGSSELAIRVPSALASLGVVVFLFIAGRVVGQTLGAGGSGDVAPRQGWSLGLLAGALAALSGFQITFAEEARPYAFAALGVAAMMAGALRIVCDPERAEGTRSLWALTALVLGMAITIWSHVLGIVAAGLLGVFLIGWWATLGGAAQAPLLRLLTAAAGLLILIWPQLGALVDQAGRDYGDFWITMPSIVDLARMTVLAIGPNGLPGGLVVTALTGAVLLSAGLVGLWRLGRGDERRVAVLGLILILSAGYWIVIVAYTYLVQPVILPRTLIFLGPPVLLLMAAARYSLPNNDKFALYAILLVAGMGAIGPQQVLDFPRPFRDIAKKLAETPGAPILTVAGDVEVLLAYYEDQLDLELDLRPLPGSWPNLVNGQPNFIDIPRVTPAQADAAIAALGDARIVYLVLRRVALTQSGDMLREKLRETGREETILLGGMPRAPETVICYADPESSRRCPPNDDRPVLTKLVR